MNSLSRRTFLGMTALAAGGGCISSQGKKNALGHTGAAITPSRERQADIVIIGGGLGGAAAALTALAMGRSVIMTEETDWIGGQCTSQAVPPDENPWIEKNGGTRRYLGYRRKIREYYRRNYPLTNAVRDREDLNPGGGNVSRLCHEPRVSLAVLQELLAPYQAAGRLLLLSPYIPIAADSNGDTISSVMVRHCREAHRCVLTGKFFLDATETGSLLPLAGVEYVTGSESQKETGEPHASETAKPFNMQAITWCFAMEYQEGKNFIGEKPRDYAYWRQYIPPMTPPWSGPLLSLDTIHPVTLEKRSRAFDPSDAAESNWWTYRRIIDRRNFVEGAFPGSVTLVNWPQNDYLPGGIIDLPEKEIQRHLEGAQQLSLSLFYWLQTEAPRPDGGLGWPGLRLRGDLTGTEHGLAMAPYIRESRRIRAAFTIKEGHVGKAARTAITGKSGEALRAEIFPDSIGIGYYRIDLHPSTGGDNYIDIDSLPFQIPLGALLPQRVKNLLPACKNIGTTHITNGCYRLHPVEWNIGESAGAFAAFCLEKGYAPRQVYENKSCLAEFQAVLTQQGVPLAWPENQG